MIIICPEIFEIKGYNQNHHWLLSKLAMRMNNQTKQCFPSLNKLCEDTGWSKPIVVKAIKECEAMGLVKVVKSKDSKLGNVSNRYLFETDFIKTVGSLKIELENDTTPSKESIPPLVNNFYYPSKENDTTPSKENDTLTTSKDITTSKENLIKKEKEKNPNSIQKFNAEDYIKSFSLQAPVLEALLAYLEIRKAKRTPTTKYAIDLLLKKLKELSKNSYELEVKIINQSIQNGWTGFFELKNSQNNGSYNSKSTNLLGAKSSYKVAEDSPFSTTF